MLYCPSTQVFNDPQVIVYMPMDVHAHFMPDTGPHLKKKMSEAEVTGDLDFISRIVGTVGRL